MRPIRARERIEKLNDDAEPTSEEIEKLAAIWWTTPQGLRRSLEEANSVG